MRFFVGLFVLLVDLDGLVRFGGDEAATRLVEAKGVHAGLAVHGARLDGRLRPLEVVARFPVPEVKRTVVGARHQNTVAVDGQAVDDGVVARQVLDELAVRALPLLDVVRRRRREHVPEGRHRKHVLSKT